MGNPKKTKKVKEVKQFKPPNDPREAIKRLTSNLNSIKRHGGLTDTQSLGYFKEVKELIKYLDGFITLAETAMGREEDRRGENRLSRNEPNPEPEPISNDVSGAEENKDEVQATNNNQEEVEHRNLGND